MSCTKTYWDSAPVSDTCPSDDEYILFVNPSNVSVFRSWVKVKECLGGNYKVISDSIGSVGTTYTNPNLSGATELDFLILNRALFTVEDGDFTFSGTTITFSSMTLQAGDKIVIPHSNT